MAFLKQENVQMLWELLLDSLPSNQTNINNLQTLFLNNVKQFGEVEKHNITPANLVSANKHFLMSMVSLINKQQNSNTNNTNNNNLTYLAKDIQAQRQNQFDIQMAQRQQEFDSLLTVKKPPVPNFADDIDLANEKLSADSIKQMINQTVSQRNYELSSNEVTTNNNKTNIFDKINNNINNKPVFKQIKIDNQDLSNNLITESVIDLSNNDKKKQVSWSENLHNDNDNNITFNILDKLKKVSNDNVISITNNEINYKQEFVSLNSKIDELTNKLNLILDLLQTNKSV